MQEYEDVHYPVGEPSLIDILKLRMYEMGLSQAALAKKIGVSPSRICDFLSGKAEPTLKVGRRISTELQIDPAIVLPHINPDYISTYYLLLRIVLLLANDAIMLQAVCHTTHRLSLMLI